MNCDLSIDFLVQKLLDLLTPDDKELFLLDRQTKLDSGKNVECFYLSDLCSEFKIYSELDLLLISYACEVSIWVDIAVPFMSVFLPNTWEQHVIVGLDEENNLVLTPSAPLSYTPGRLSNVYEFLHVPTLVGFPKPLKESSHAIEEDSAGVEEAFQEYKGEVSCSWDIDGMFGFVPDYVLNPFKSNINVYVDIKANLQIFNKKLVHKNRPIKDSCHIKVGCLETLWGKVNLFIVFNEREGGNYLALFLKNISVLLEKPTRENSEISGCVESHEIPGFLQQLRFLYPGSMFFIEAYGTKNAISNKKFYAVFTKLFEIFDVSLVPELTYDIALRAVPQQFVCLFISPNTFKRLHVRPNYKLAFCNNMANHNNVKIRADGENTFYNYGCVDKINFYSLLEDMIEELRKTSFLPVVSLKLAQQDLEGLVFKKGESLSFNNKIGTIKRNMESVSRLGYRFEMTTKGRYLSTVHNVLYATYKQCEFLCFDYRRFKFVFLSNLYYINSLIGGNTITDLFNNISAEMTLKEAYLKGSINKHFLPESYNIKPFFSSTGIRRLNDSFRAAISIERDSGIRMMHKLLTNASLKCLKDGFIDLLKSFLFVLESNSPSSCISKVFKQYLNDYSRHYNLEGPEVLNYRRLGPHIAFLKEEERTVSLSYFLQTNFLGEKPRKAMFPYIYLLDFVKNKFLMTQDELLDKCYTIWKYHGINIAWIHLNNPEAGSKLLTLLNLDVISIGGHNKDIWMNSLASQTKIYLAQQGMESLRPKRVKWTRCEHIRLLNGLLRYNSLSNKFTLLYNDFVYGFYLTRPAQNALSDAWRTLEKKVDLLDLLKEAINWNPDQYSVEFCINDEIDTSYKYLHTLDKSRFKPVSVEGLNAMYSEHLVGKITLQDYEELKELIITQPISREINEFRSAHWKPFEEAQESIYVWENRPCLEDVPTIPIPMVRIESPVKETNRPVYVTMDHINELKKEITELQESNKQLIAERLLDRAYLERLQAEYLGFESLQERKDAESLPSSPSPSFSPDHHPEKKVEKLLHSPENAEIFIESISSPSQDVFDFGGFSPDYSCDDPIEEEDDDRSFLQSTVTTAQETSNGFVDLPKEYPSFDLLSVENVISHQDSFPSDNLHFSNLDGDFLVLLLHKKMKNKNFTAEECLKKCIPSSKRPSISVFTIFLENLVSLNILGVKKIRRKKKFVESFYLLKK